MKFHRPAAIGLIATLLACGIALGFPQPDDQDLTSKKPGTIAPSSSQPSLEKLSCSPADPPGAATRVNLPTASIRRDLRVWRDVELVQGVISVKFDVYRPDDNRKLPLVLMIHGGAWSMGDKRTLEMHARELAKEGFVAVSTNYRLAPQHPFPAQLCDCDRVLQWFLSGDNRFGASTSKYALWGYSAGAQLAALMTCLQTQNDRPPTCCVVGGIPADFRWVPGNSDMLAHVFGGTPDTHPEAYRRASPIEYVTSNLCPFFLYHGTRDFIVPCEVSHRMHAKLVAANVESELLEIPGKEHFFAFIDSTARRRAIAFIQEKFFADQKDR